MNVVWYTKAKETWQKTLQYVRLEYGYRSAIHFREDTNAVVKQIKTFPNSAPIEELLQGQNLNFEVLRLENIIN